MTASSSGRTSPRRNRSTPCRRFSSSSAGNTAVAREVHDWLANGNDGYGVSPSLFKNAPGQEVTVRIDSKVIEDIEEGGTKDREQTLAVHPRYRRQGRMAGRKDP